MEFLIPELTFFVFGLLTGALVSWLFQYLASKKAQFDYEDLLLEREQDLHNIEELTKDKKAYEDKIVKLESNFAVVEQLKNGNNKAQVANQEKLAKLESGYTIANQLLKEENTRAQTAEKKLKEEHVRAQIAEKKLIEENTRLQTIAQKLKEEKTQLEAEVTKKTKDANMPIQAEVAQKLQVENTRLQTIEQKLKAENIRLQAVIEQKTKEIQTRPEETAQKLQAENVRIQAVEQKLQAENIRIQAEVVQRLKEENASIQAVEQKLKEENTRIQTQLEQKVKEEVIRTQNAEQKIKALELELEESKRTEQEAILNNQNNLQLLLKQQKAENEEIRISFKEEFALMASQLLEEKSQKITTHNQQTLGALLEPLNQKIKDFESEVKATHLKDSEQRASIMEQFKQLSELNQQMSQEAQNLTKALQGDNAYRGGNWGEMVLEKILEKSGLVKGQEYETQKRFNGINGNGSQALQPDVIINLPQNRHIIIDSKVPLSAYERYNAVEANDETSTEVLKEHLLSIAKHIKQLNSKNYHHIYQLQTLDFILLFVPIEGAFSLAIQQDADLFNTAFENNIILVSPTTLLATLRTVANIWRQEKQTRNALEIARKSGDLYDKFVGFAEDLQGVGRHLLQTERSYEAAMEKLCAGEDNLVQSADKIKQLGARASKEIPQNLKEENYLVE